MAHMIESDNMVYAGDRPWHGIGEYLGVSDNADLESVLRAKPIIGSGISHRSALVSDGKGGVAKIPDTYCAVRDFDGKILGVVGDQQRQSGASPRRLLQSLQNIVGPGRAMLHTAAYLRDGRVFMATCKLGNPIEVTAPNGTTKDQTDFYLVAVTAFDGSMLTNLYETIVRAVCMNTLRASMADLAANNRKATKIKHTRAHESKLQDAEREWSDAVTRYSLFKRTVEILARAPIQDAQALEIIRGAFGIKVGTPSHEISTRTANNVETVQNLYHGGKGNAPWTGTAWGVLNSLTEFADHNMIVRGVRDSEGKISDTSESGRSKILDSALFGSAADFKARAFQLVTQAARVSL
jgi:phage/plasmid-like protein (TIGR03299 family)